MSRATDSIVRRRTNYHLKPVTPSPKKIDVPIQVPACRESVGVGLGTPIPWFGHVLRDYGFHSSPISGLEIANSDKRKWPMRGGRATQRLSPRAWIASKLNSPKSYGSDRKG